MLAVRAPSPISSPRLGRVRDEGGLYEGLPVGGLGQSS